MFGSKHLNIFCTEFYGIKPILDYYVYTRFQFIA